MASDNPFNSFNTYINVLLGTGPILLPPAVADAGIGLSSFWLAIMFFLSQWGAEFVVESLSICNAIQKDKNIFENDGVEVPLTNIQKTSSETSSKAGSIRREDVELFELTDTYEYVTMGSIIGGRKAEIFNAVNIILYLYGVMITKGIIVGTTFQNVFYHIEVAGSYYFWVVLFFLISGGLSFKNIASITWLQTGIAMVRYLTILIMYVGAIIMIAKHGDQPALAWKSNEFPNLFSTSVLAYLTHHSIPGMLRPVKPSSAIKYIINFAQLFGLLVFITVPLTGMLAFPGLSKYCYYNTLFDQDDIKFAYYIISFYMFLNIAALPVITITLRTNMMKLCVPHLLPKSSFEINKWTIVFTLIIVLPCMILALVLQNEIQFVVGITGGVCGTILMMVIPPLMVIYGRKLTPAHYTLNPNRTTYTHIIFPIICLLCASLFLPFNLYVQIHDLILEAKNEKSSCYDAFYSNITNYTSTSTATSFIV